MFYMITVIDHEANDDKVSQSAIVAIFIPLFLHYSIINVDENLL